MIQQEVDLPRLVLEGIIKFGYFYDKTDQLKIHFPGWFGVKKRKKSLYSLQIPSLICDFSLDLR